MRAGKDVASERQDSSRVTVELDSLDRAIKAYQVDYQRFFAGDLPWPPKERGEAIQGHLRRLRNEGLRAVADRYRLGSLEARFNSYQELFGRREREQERSRARAQPDPQPDPEEGVLVGKNGHDTAAEVLYKGLYLSQADRPGMDLERFRSYLDKQAEVVRAKTGCADVLFRVAHENGKMKLKAKPVRRGGAG